MSTTDSSAQASAPERGVSGGKPAADTEDPSKGLLKSQWQLGVVIAILPIAIIIYFLFFWQPDRGATVEVADDVTEIERAEVVPAKPESTSDVVRVPPKLRDTTGTSSLSKEEIEKVIESRLSQLEAEKRKLESSSPSITQKQSKLDTSDDEVLEALAALSPSLEWYIWLYTDEVVRKFVTVVDNLAEGKVISKYISVPRPSKPVAVMEVTDRKFLDTSSYERYNAYADIFDAINNDSLVEVYWEYFPLLEEAYAELGYPDDRRFHDTMLSALDNLVAAPVIHDEIELESLTPVLYKFADPQLEALPSAHKQLIRMGPRNTLIISRKLEELKVALRR